MAGGDQQKEVTISVCCCDPPGRDEECWLEVLGGYSRRGLGRKHVANTLPRVIFCQRFIRWCYPHEAESQASDIILGSATICVNWDLPGIRRGRIRKSARARARHTVESPPATIRHEAVSPENPLQRGYQRRRETEQPITIAKCSGANPSQGRSCPSSAVFVARPR